MRVSVLNLPSDRDNSNREYLERELRGYIDQSQKDSETIKELQRKNLDHEDVYSAFSAEIMRLNNVVGEVINKNNHFKKEVDFLQHKVKACEESLDNRKVVLPVTFHLEAEARTRVEISEGKLRSYEGEMDLLK